MVEDPAADHEFIWGFPHGHPNFAKFPETTLVANHPLWRCPNCGYLAADWRAGEACDAAVVAYRLSLLIWNKGPQ